jgi:cobaltochelatase CobS
MSDLKSAVSAAIKAKLAAEKNPLFHETKDAASVPDPMFKTAPVGSTENKVSYSSIVGCAHPSGKEYWFTKININDWDEEVQKLVPEIDPAFEFDHNYALNVLMAIEYNKTIFAFGPPGSGKSSTPEQICARIGYPYMFIAGMGGTEPSDYVGTPWVSHGSMEWKDAAASYAVRHGIFLLYDEPFKASAQTNMCFQSLLDHRRTLKLYGHPDPIKGSLKAHPKFRMCLADNVRGTGDQMDKYAAEIQDQSFLNRSAYKVHVDYVPSDTEKKILKNLFPEATDKLLNGTVALAGLIRNAWKKGEVELPYSLRDTRELVEAALIHQDVGVAFHQTYYGYIQDDSEKKALRDAWKMAFPYDKIA